MEEGKEEAASRDIRRYYCEFCGICRSKKALIAAHILSHHKEEAEMKKNEAGDGAGAPPLSSYDCEECGASFRKPAHLKQHMTSHSTEHWIPLMNSKMQRGRFDVLEWTSSRTGDPPVKLLQATPQSRTRPFQCPVDNCHAKYRRKDHLNRHLLGHQGKLFACSNENCNRKFAFQANLKRHMKEFHEEGSYVGGPKLHICPEIGCRKAFKFASKLKKHELSHVKLEFAEVICSEPGCMKYFSNVECLQAHIRTCHKYVTCEVCGSRQLKKNLKRHLDSHKEVVDAEKIRCSFNDCDCTFSTISNLKQHVNSVHLNLRRFTCRVSGCGKTFPYKHVRDNHEKSGAHVHVHGDFLESDRQFQSRPRGGRKRKAVNAESLLRKRIVPPGHGTESVLTSGSEYLSWLLSQDD